jgi:UPF0042 nucleotide-binding protein
MLEDHGYYCIDNLPASLLPAFVKRISSETLELPRVAVSIDARNIPQDLKKVPQIIEDLKGAPLNTDIIFLDASNPTLIKRFSESRRKHPLTTESIGLREAIIKERELLEPISALASLSIDTSTMSIHQLRDVIRTRVLEKKDSSLALMFESFGFKSGVPVDADFVFDARCLPNPYWDPQLRALTGLDPAVIKFLSEQKDVVALQTDIAEFLEKWLPRFEASNRSYMTVAVGCTGGQHRSVYLCEQLNKIFAGRVTNVQVLHRDLSKHEAARKS